MQVKIGIIQSKVYLDKEITIKNCLAEVTILAKQGAQLIALPEMFNCPYTNKYFSLYAEQEGGYTWSKLSQCAKENKIYLIGGSIPEQDGDKIYNTCFVFDPHGQQIAKHRKIHLFDIAIEGGQHFKESDTFTPGNAVTTFDTIYGTMGVVICYDYRFPELARLTTLQGAMMIFVPAAFNMTTGPAHWEVMHRSRAIDNQIFSIGISPSRNDDGGYKAYGNSMVVSPWGEVLYQADERTCSTIVDINLEKIIEIRDQLPLLKHRRTDVYQLKKL